MKKVNGIYAAVLLAAVWFVSCQQAFAECGIASTYSSGSRTANGEHYNHMGVSAAHKSLPFGTRVVVRNQRTGRSITVRINDRGPFVAGRVIDLSTGAKNALGMGGLVPVCLEVVSYGSGIRGYHRTTVRNPLVVANRASGRKFAKASGRTRSARAGSGRNNAQNRHGMRRYAHAHRGHGYSRKSSHRRQFASRDD